MPNKIPKSLIKLNEKLIRVNSDIKINIFFDAKADGSGDWIKIEVDGIEKPGDWRYKQIVNDDLYREINEFLLDCSKVTNQTINSENDWFITKTDYDKEFIKRKEEIKKYFIAKSWINPDGLNWNERELRAQKLENIPHNCNFKDGKCRGIQEIAWTKSKMCCCQVCPNEFGYARAINPEALEFYLENFDPKYGFWRENVGCILPWKWRSNTCISFTCRKDYKEVSKLLQEYLDGKNDVFHINKEEI